MLLVLLVPIMMTQDEWDDGENNNGDDDNAKNDGGDVGEDDQSQHPLIQFIGEAYFTHYMQDEHHESKRASLNTKTIKKIV